MNQTQKETQIQKLSKKSEIRKMTLLFMFLYLISYITRINYGAVISEIVHAQGMPRPEASLALTASAVTYGVGQILSGFLGDRLNPKKLIFAGLIVTLSMNLVIPFCKAALGMTAAWAINGMAQAFMWPPLIKIMTTIFHKEDYQRSCLVVSFASSIGTMLVYLLSPLCIYLGGWRLIFFVSAICAAVMAAVWYRKCPDPGKQQSTAAEKKAGTLSHRVYLILGLTMLAIALQGVLRDGVTTWMPSYIADTFHLDNKFAILTGVVLPVISILMLQVASILYRKKIRTELTLASLMFFGGFLASFLMFLANGMSAGISVALAAALSGFMHGANWVMTSMIPPHFAKYGNISFISGLLNFSAYIGSAASAYGIAAFSERFSWNSTLFLWAMLALAGCVVCFFSGIYWRWLKKNNEL